MKKLMILCAAVVFAASAMAQTPTPSQEVECGSSVRLTATPAPGYHFVQWEDDATAPNPRDITNIKDATLKNYKAIFAANDYNFGVDVTLDPATPDVGQALKLTASPTDDCLEFEKWSDGNTINPRIITYDGTAPFTAVYKTKVYTVSGSADDSTHGSVTITPIVP